MTDEEKIRKCIELVWDYEENYDGDDLLNFQNKELSTYTQHESVVATFNKYIQLEKENAELKAHCNAVDDINVKLRNCHNCNNWNWKHNKCEKKLKGDCFKQSKWELAE